MESQQNENFFKVEFTREAASFGDLACRFTLQGAEDFVRQRYPYALFLNLGGVGMVGSYVALDSGIPIALLVDTSLRPTLERVSASLFAYECPAERVHGQTLRTLLLQVNEIINKLEEIKRYLPGED